MRPPCRPPVHATAEDAPLEAGAFDAVTASMCWGYLDHGRVVPRLWSALRPGGALALASLLWSAGGGPVARLTAEVLRRHHPAFARRGRAGRCAAPPGLGEGSLPPADLAPETVMLRFTREGWRGRQRAGKWVGAALPPGAVAAFDAELARALEERAPAEFAIPHAVGLQIFERIP